MICTELILNSLNKYLFYSARKYAFVTKEAESWILCDTENRVLRVKFEMLQMIQMCVMIGGIL